MSLVGKLIGNYKVTAKIGEGGMGSVYLGEHPMIGKKVAIKSLHPDLAMKEDIIGRFFTEAKAVNDIGHPNIVDIVDFGKMRDEELNGDVVYFIMEYLDGEGLNTRLKREGCTPRETIHILRQCCSALAASHKKNIIHRDLKPENIYLVTRGEDRNYTKLLDFGIAKLTGGGEGGVSQHKTRTGLVIGTPSYMSPEQCEGKGNIDWRSDVYSLGVVMYEMITGRVPFPGDGFGEILVAHITKTPELPSTIRPDVPPSLEAIVMHALEKDKNRRFQSMDEFGAALDDPGAHLEAFGSPSGRADSQASGTMMMPAAGDKSVRIPTGQGPRPATGQGPRPTTLSGASGEMGEGQAAGGKSRAGLFAALGVLVVAGAAGAVYFSQHKAVVQPVVSPVVVAPVVKAPEKVKVKFDSIPPGAKVFKPGVAEHIGVTPFEYEATGDEPDFDVRLTLEGYKDEIRSVTPARSRGIQVMLSKVEVPVAPIQPVVAEPQPVKPVSGKGGHRTGAVKGGGKKGGGAGDKDDVMEPQF